VIRIRHIEVDRFLYEALTQHIAIEIHIPLRLTGDSGHVM
jgi:hypothetical protein